MATTHRHVFDSDVLFNVQEPHPVHGFIRRTTLGCICGDRMQIDQMTRMPPITEESLMPHAWTAEHIAKMKAQGRESELWVW